MPIDLELDSILFKAVADLDNDDRVIDILSEVKEIDMPSFLEDRIVNIEEDDRDEVSLTFGTEDSSEVISFVLGEERGDLKIYMIFDGVHRSEMNSALSEVLEYTESVTVDKLKVFLDLDREFDSLELPITSEEKKYLVKGLRLENEGIDYILQSEEEKVAISAGYNESFEISSGYDSDIFLEKTKEAEDFLEEFS